MFCEGNMMYLFGGVSQLLSERNDLWSFDQNSWCCVDEGGSKGSEITRLGRMRGEHTQLLKMSTIMQSDNSNDSSPNASVKYKRPVDVLIHEH
jgi:hypothetical protein